MNKLLDHWQLKLFALCGALIVWFTVNKSILAKTTVRNVPIKVINISEGRAVKDLLPSGYLAQGVDLTIYGVKNLIESVDASDIEIRIDISGYEDDLVLSLRKTDLYSLSTDIDVTKVIQNIDPTTIIIRQSQVVTADVPIGILPPKGFAPRGFQFLDIWPIQLSQKIKGPEDVVRKVESSGLTLQFNLSSITPSLLKRLGEAGSSDDEISLKIPEGWKQVFTFPLRERYQSINDPKANLLSINFLIEKAIPFTQSIPIYVYYSSDKLAELNSKTLPLASSDYLSIREGYYYLSVPLFVKNVSQTFLNIVQDYLQFVVVAHTNIDGVKLDWSLHFVNPKRLEERYIDVVMSQENKEYTSLSLDQDEILKSRKLYLKNRFKDYMKRFELYLNEQQRAEFVFKINDSEIKLEINGED